MPRFDDFPQYIQDAMQSWGCPGAAVAVIQGDTILHSAAYGSRDLEAGLPVTPDSRFAMASVTKSFTAMSVALMVDDGLIEWDKPIREFLPEFRLKDEYATQHITVRDMLCHRSGLPRHDLASWRLGISRAEQVRRLRYFEPNATFREKFQYNNQMYYAIAYLVERLTGKRWEDFIQERIFDKLGMTASNFDPQEPQPGQHTAWGYRIERDLSGKPQKHFRVPYGEHSEVSPGSAGALFSTLADMTQWLKVHLNNGVCDGIQIVSAGSLKQMHLPQMVMPGGGISEAIHGSTIITYGMGWFVEPYHGYTMVQHGGNTEAFSVIIGFVPQKQVGVVVLTNAQSMILRDVLLYECVDRALDLEANGWNEKFHQVYDPLFAAYESGKQTSAGERIADAQPSHHLEDYAGTYAADGYPDFEISVDQEVMQARLVGAIDWAEFRHYHYDIFEWHLIDFDQRLKVRFLTNDNGEIESISIPIEEAVENVIFRRKPLDLPEEVRERLVGEYVPPVAGMTFTVTHQQGKIWIAQQGGAAEEIHAFRQTDTLLIFKSKRTRFEFLREHGRIIKLTIKLPDFTLEAPRKPAD